MKIYWYNGSKNVIGPAVRRLRKENGLTQKELAEQVQLQGVEMDDLAVLRIEKGLRFAADYEVRALAEVFRVNMEELFSEEPDEET